MNLNTLENLVRLTLKGKNVATESNNMLNSGLLSPAEHRSVSSLSWQIAANMRVGTEPTNTVALKLAPTGAWI